MDLKHANVMNQNQFKLIMFDVFKVQDHKLLDEIFQMIDTNNNGFAEIYEIISNIVFMLRAPLEHKFALFFEVQIAFNKNRVVPRTTLVKLV